MKTATVTLYCKINYNNIVINNGMSFGIDLLEANKNIFFSINDSVDKLKYFVRSYDRVYVSVYSTMEFKFIKPILDKRWIIGGPISKNKNLNMSYNFINQTIPEYVGVNDYKLTNFSTYFKPLMTMFPNHIVGSIVASLGGKCYWGKCKFCSFVDRDRDMIFGNDIHKILDKVNTLNGKYAINLAIPGVLPKQLKTVLQHDLDSNKSIHAYMIPSKGISKILGQFDNREMKNFMALVGLESMNEINRSILNKGTNSEDILECLKHIVRLGGLIDLPLMAGFFNTTKESVEQTKMFLIKLEDTVPRKNIANLIWNNDIYIRWPVHQREYLESLTSFSVVEYKENLRSYLKVEIPKNSKVYKYNKQIKEIIQGSHLCTNLNETPTNILDEEYNS